jgi:hypothetical protein
MKDFTWLADYPNEAGGDPRNYDYFLFHPDDFPKLGADRIETVIDRDPTSGVLLAKIRPSR